VNEKGRDVRGRNNNKKKAGEMRQIKRINGKKIKSYI
jgi:hypothetical protein